MAIEQCAPFPWWPRGRHPWLDAFVETKTHIIGIESKRYEPFRGKAAGRFSKTYWRPVWGEAMEPYEAMRDRLANGTTEFDRLDGVQLVKHALGLRTEGTRRAKSAVLVYLHAEPQVWPDGRDVSGAVRETHAREAQRFAAEVAGAEVAFRICTYRRLLSVLREIDDPGLVRHADRLDANFSL